MMKSLRCRPRILWVHQEIVTRPRPVRCLRCLLLVMCTHPFAKKELTLHLVRSEGHEGYFGCNLMHRKVLASSHQHLMTEAPPHVLLSVPGRVIALNLFITLSPKGVRVQ